jgi:hypothetical protein
MFVAQRGPVVANFLGVGFIVRNGKKGFAADFAVKQIQNDHLIPLVSKHMLKFNRILGANAPARAAPGTASHIVQQRPFFGRILNVDGIGRTVLQTCQTAIAPFIHLEIDHLNVS